MKRSRQYIMFPEGYVDKNKNHLAQGVKYVIKSQDSAYFYVGKCKVDKLISKNLYYIGESCE